MFRYLFAITVVGTAWGLVPIASIAAENAPAGSATTKPHSVTPQATQRSHRKEAVKAPAPAKLVDLNRASKKELRSLQGISDAMADKIIAGRPYNSKAAIVTNGAVPEGIYVAIRRQIVVR